ncbi:MAG TPA: hypothetical protein VJ961_00470 [Mariprofundaceae bacterium]|nr:hypothetical protein [Mariprofundaceae bacterium]
MIRQNEIVSGEIREFIMEGVCDLNEITKAIEKHYHGGLKGVLWNASDAQISHFTASEMRTIAYVAKQHTSHRKTAYCSPNDSQFGILRMYEAYAEIGEVAPLMMVFRERDEAIEWLKE